MKISTWRNAFKLFVARLIPEIDAWEAEKPSNTAQVTAFMPPLTNIRYYLANGLVYGNAIQAFGVVYRLPKSYKYNDLPIQSYEAVHANFSIHLATEWREIAELTELQLMSVNPIQVQEMGDTRGDWIISIIWQANITWIAELEIPVLPAYDIREVNVAIHRALAQDNKVVVTVDTPNVIDNILHITRDGE